MVQENCKSQTAQQVAEKAKETWSKEEGF